MHRRRSTASLGNSRNNRPLKELGPRSVGRIQQAQQHRPLRLHIMYETLSTPGGDVYRSGLAYTTREDRTHDYAPSEVEAVSAALEMAGRNSIALYGYNFGPIARCCCRPCW
jgi:hypothetical protein